jgi:putative PIN family toxin of toxin-antitoxin system
MRVVLDTNVLTRAFASPHGPAGELFEQIVARHTLLISGELVVELAAVLRYERVREMHKRTDSEIDEFVESLKIGATTVLLHEPVPRIVPHDSDDDMIIATAVVGKGDAIWTRNRHLFHENVLSYCRENEIEIMDDLMLLNRIRQQQQREDEA